MLTNKLKILFSSYEVAPFYKQGGLADVAGSLPKAIKQLGADIRIIMPYYRTVKKNFPQIKKYKNNLQAKLNGRKIKFQLFKALLPASRVIIYFIDAPEYFQVNNIFDKKMKERFLIFSELIINILQNNYLNWQPQLIHNNDWQTAGVALKVKLLNLNYKTLLTIHNIGYAGRTKIKILKKAGYREADFSQIKNNKVNLLREAILKSDKINTVSPTYAKQILQRDYGYDMADALQKRKRDLSGILNGLDEQLFNPVNDRALKATYDIKKINRKEINKLWLQKKSRLTADPEIPLIGMVSRLAGQKGFDILEQALPELMRLNIQLIILGTGEKRYEQFFRQANKNYPAKLKAYIKFDGQLARQIYAGSDMFLMPSLYEPCGLGQLIAMKYGTVPIVRLTGGLKDTVKEIKIQTTNSLRTKNLKQATGFGFKQYKATPLIMIIKQAITFYQDKNAWQQLIKNAMRQDFSWQQAAKNYLRLYNKAVKD